MSKRVRRIVAGLVVAVTLLSAGAGVVAAFVPPSAHPPMPCCDSPDDCAARLRAVSCCAPGQLPDAAAPTPVAVSVTMAKVAPELPAAQPEGGFGLVSSVAREAFALASLKRPHDPPYLLHSVFLI
jgi:hypothetical protein